MMMQIKELLRHVYPSCQVIVYYDGNRYCTIVGDFLNTVDEDEYCDDFAFYKDHLAIFMG